MKTKSYLLCLCIFLFPLLLLASGKKMPVLKEEKFVPPPKVEVVPQQEKTVSPDLSNNIDENSGVDANLSSQPQTEEFNPNPPLVLEDDTALGFFAVVDTSWGGRYVYTIPKKDNPIIGALLPIGVVQDNTEGSYVLAGINYYYYQEKLDAKKYGANSFAVGYKGKLMVVKVQDKQILWDLIIAHPSNPIAAGKEGEIDDRVNIIKRQKGLLKTNHPAGPLMATSDGSYILIMEAGLITPINDVVDSVISVIEDDNRVDNTTTGIILTKISKQGRVIWQKLIGGYRHKYTNAKVIEDRNGDYVAVATAYTNKTDIVLFKTNSNGVLINSTVFGTDEYDYGESFIQDSDGDYVVCGSTEKKGIPSRLLLRVSEDFSQSEAITIGQANEGGPGEIAHSITEAVDGGYVLSGTTFTYGPKGPSERNLLVTKISHDLTTLEWARAISSIGGFCFGLSIVPTQDSGFITTGDGPMVVKLSNEGKLQWTQFTDNGKIATFLDGGGGTSSSPEIIPNLSGNYMLYFKTGVVIRKENCNRKAWCVYSSFSSKTRVVLYDNHTSVCTPDSKTPNIQHCKTTTDPFKSDYVITGLMMGEVRSDGTSNFTSPPIQSPKNEDCSEEIGLQSVEFFSNEIEMISQTVKPISKPAGLIVKDFNNSVFGEPLEDYAQVRQDTDFGDEPDYAKYSSSPNGK